MKVNDSLKYIDIIYPKAMDEASPEALAICEGFITRLIQSKKNTIKIKIDTILKFVECNDNTIKQYLDIMLKSKKLNDFYNQFFALMHKNIEPYLNGAVLRCCLSEDEIKFVVIEKQALPDFAWEVTRVAN